MSATAVDAGEPVSRSVSGRGVLFLPTRPHGAP